MDCRETSLLISPHLDGALSKDEEATLAEHVAVCEDCARELALQERLSGALRGLSRKEIQAPPELCGLVMTKLQKERRGTLLWLPVVWRKAAAAAAAVLLIAGGYAGVTAGLAGGGKMVVSEITTPNVNPDGGVASDKIPKDSLSQPNGSVQPPDNTGNPANAGEKNTVGSETGKETGNATTTDNNKGNNIDSSKTPAVNNAGTYSERPRALLSSGIKVINTDLRMAVDDLRGARAEAVALAAGAGAETQVLLDSKKIVLIRITTTSDKAPGLIAGLSRVGTLVDRNDGSTDYTSIYNETLVQYNDLQSRISAARDAGEQSQMEAQAASYKQQLDDWEAKADKRIILLRLESK